VAITKLLIKQNGESEDAEKAKDYIAMHVYRHNKIGERILKAGHPLVKSNYMNEQTVMMYLKNLDFSDCLKPDSFFNLVLDQT